MITIHFDFEDRKSTDILQLNNILATMQLDELKIDNFDDYIETTTDTQGNFIGKRYGLKRGMLVCSPAKDGNGHQYRMDSAVTSQETDSDEFLQQWKSFHPDRIVRIFTRSAFGDMVGCLIVHHQMD